MSKIVVGSAAEQLREAARQLRHEEVKRTYDRGRHADDGA